MVKVTFHELINFTDKQKAKARLAAAHIEYVIASPEFKTWCENQKFTSTTDTGAEVYQKIIAGVESLDSVKTPDNEFDIRWKLVRSWIPFNSVIGYTYPNDKRLYTYSNKYNQMSIEFLAGHLLHEELHKLGWNHDFKATPQRPYSVPYLVGNYVAKFPKNKIFANEK